MKKSKIIVPALGIILLSTVASVTGTVAWFTANSRYNVNVSTFEIGKLVGELKCELVKGIGTTVDNSAKKVELKSDIGSDTGVTTILTDASYSGSGSTFYSVPVANRNVTTSSNETINTFKAVDASYRNITGETPSAVFTRGTSEKCAYFYAASRTMNFQYEFQGNTAAQDLFLDFSTTGAKTSVADLATVGTAGTSGESSKGFRMAFVAGSTTLVWAPFDTTTGNHVVAESGTSNIVAWASPTLLAVSDTSTDQKLGTFTTSANSIAVTCYAWFEGTDHTNIINTTTLQKFTAGLQFTVKAAA